MHAIVGCIVCRENSKDLILSDLILTNLSTFSTIRLKQKQKKYSHVECTFCNRTPIGLNLICLSRSLCLARPLRSFRLCTPQERAHTQAHTRTYLSVRALASAQPIGTRQEEPTRRTHSAENRLRLLLAQSPIVGVYATCSLVCVRVHMRI